MRRKQSVVIAVTNKKGGCGKTTTSVSLAAGLARLGYTACVIDNDEQCNATQAFGLDINTRSAAYTVADAYLAQRPMKEIITGFPEEERAGLYLAPSHRGLAGVEKQLTAEIEAYVVRDEQSALDADEMRAAHRMRLKNSVDSLRGSVDFILIDTPPNLGFLMISALIAADRYLIPIFPAGFELKGLELLTETANKVRTRLNPRLSLLGIVLGYANSRAKLDDDIYKMLQEDFGKDLVFETIISGSVKHREATVYGRTIFEHAPEHQAASQFSDLAAEFVRRLEKATLRVDSSTASKETVHV